MPRQNVILVFSKPPRISRTNSTEPYASLPWDDLDALFSAFTVDVLYHACGVPETDVMFYRNPSEPQDEYLYRLREEVKFRELQGEHFTAQVDDAVERAFSDGYYRVVVVLDNHPTLSPRFFGKVLEQLKYEDDCTVVGPTVEGKCFLVGLKGNHSGLFDSSQDNPLLKPFGLMERLCRLDGILFLTEPRYMLDSGFSLARLWSELQEPGVRDHYVAERSYEVFRSINKKYRLKYAMR
jgi:hypothetical protein